MMALHSRLTTTMFVLACALCAPGLIRARAQEVTPASENGGKCPTAGAPFVDPLSAPHWNGWGVDSSQHRFQPSVMAQLAPDDVPRLKVKWAFGYPGAVRAFAQPTIAAGRLFVGSQNGKVYSLDSGSGCIYWEFNVEKPVRSAIVIGHRADGWSVYFGDFSAHVYAVDAITGRDLWKTRIEDHPAARITGSPTLVGATLFVPVSSSEEGTGANPTYPCCSFRGSLVAVEASTGKLQWKGYTIVQEAKSTGTNSAGVEMMGPSGAAIWSSPTFDGVTRRVYVTTGDNYSAPPTNPSDAILAFDAESGELVWSRQTTTGDAYNLACVRSERANCPQADGPDYDFGSSAVLTVLPGGLRPTALWPEDLLASTPYALNAPGPSAGPSGGPSVRLTWQNQGKRHPSPRSRRTPRTMISASQCRCARTLLRWSVSKLSSAASVSGSEIDDFELERRQPSAITADAIRRAFEGAGVVFLPKDDVQLRSDVSAARSPLPQ